MHSLWIPTCQPLHWKNGKRSWLGSGPSIQGCISNIKLGLGLCTDKGILSILREEYSVFIKYKRRMEVLDTAIRKRLITLFSLLLLLISFRLLLLFLTNAYVHWTFHLLSLMLCMIALCLIAQLKKLHTERQRLYSQFLESYRNLSKRILDSTLTYHLTVKQRQENHGEQ